MANILLVLNDVAAGFELRRVLNGAGHTTLLEFDGRDALRALEQSNVDVIACDQVLPGSLGTDLIVAGRMILQRPDLPAILFGELPQALAYEMFDAEPVQVLRIPYTGEQVVSMLEQLGFGARTNGRGRVLDSGRVDHGGAQRPPFSTPRARRNPNR